MTTPNNSGPNYGSVNAYSDILRSAAEGASSALQSNANYANSKKEAKEAKRRTLANLFNNSLKRRNAMFRVGQEYDDDMNDYKTQAIQQIARGFVDSLQGSTGREI